MSRCLPVLLLLAFPVAAQRADRPARELLFDSPAVLLVEPIDGRQPGAVRIVEVIRGERLQRGDVLNGSQLADGMKDETGPDWANLRQALLFGQTGEKAGDPFRLLPTGVRLTTTGERSWVAQSRTTGGFRLVAAPALDWQQLLAQVRNDARSLAQLETLRRQPASSQRSRQLIAWMERHPPGRILPPGPLEPRTPPSDLGETGWAELETAPLRWVFQSGNPEDSWDALTVYARLHGGTLSGRDGYPFAGPEGRALLRARVQQPGGLEGDALRALHLLAWAETYPQEAVPGAPFARPLAEDEQKTLLETVKPLLTRADNRWKQAAARALVALVQGRAPVPEGLRQELARSIEAVQKDAKPGITRNVLTEAIYRLDPQRRPPAGLILDLTRRDNRLLFWLAVHPQGSVTEVPTLLLEEIAGDGKATEVLQEPFPGVSPPDWKTGWDTRRPLYAELPLRKLKTGATYRLTISGTLGPEKVKWTTEPRTFKTEMPNTAPGQPWPAATGKIVFDEE